MYIILTIVAVLALVFVLCVMGRKGHKGLHELRGWAYAHRGLHGNGVPENSMAAFQAALEAGYGIELDVHLMKDGNLAVIHDASLKRTAGVELQIEDLTMEDLPSYPLEGTQQIIPTFRQVLDLYDGKAPLIIELKAERGNHAALCDAVCKTMDTYQGAFCIESFDPRCVLWLRKNRPDIIRGQLTKNFLRDKKSKLPWILKFVLTHQLINIATLPDFIAYGFDDRKTLSVWLCRKLWGVQGVTWTLTSQADYDTATQEGYLPIFENFLP